MILVDDSVSLTVHAVSYATYYAEKTMDDYLAENITAEMSEYEIADLCCQFVAGYDYSTEASGYTSMIVTGGGDCWASTATLLYMLKQEGISCASRNASTDSGAGSQHVNVVAQLDGAYYILEAGYTGTAPRTYTMEQMNASSVFTYAIYGSNTAYITGLVLDDGITELTIPEEIDGYTVTGIADGAFSTNHNLVSVYLPDTVTYLGEKAFYQNYSLESIRLSENLTTIGTSCFAWDESLEEIGIPASVTTINGNVFCYCDVLSAIHVAESNQSYTSVDGVLFDKDMVTLLIFPAGKSNIVRPTDGFDMSTYLSQLETDYIIPDGVECISRWAFAGVDLHSVTFPDSVTEIQSYAFYYAYIYSIELPANMTTVSSYAFQICSMHALTIPSSVQTIEEYAFYKGSFAEITILEGVTSIGAYAFAGIGTRTVKIPASVKEIGENAFYFEYGWSSMNSSSTSSTNTSDLSALFFEESCAPDIIGDGAFTNTVLCVYEGSDMYEYAVENDLAYYLVNADGTVELQSDWLSGINTSWPFSSVYTGEAITPSLKWSTTDGVCPFYLPSSSYQVTYSDNINIGTCTITVTGVGLFSGEITTTFTISAADPSADVIDRSGCGLQYSISQGEVTIVSYIESALQTDLIIPDTIDGYPVTGIANYALDITNLVSVTIPDSVTNIGEGAFWGCEELTTVKMPSSVTSIDTGAFLSCNKLTDVYYSGSEDEFNQITIDIGNNCLLDATIHYSDDVADAVEYALGDVNNDGYVDYLDAMTVLRCDAELITLTDEQLLAGDVNGDGSVDSLDAILILRYDAGLIDEF